MSTPVEPGAMRGLRFGSGPLRRGRREGISGCRECEEGKGRKWGGRRTRIEGAERSRKLTPGYAATERPYAKLAQDLVAPEVNGSALARVVERKKGQVLEE
jgi:hypothetical protein